MQKKCKGPVDLKTVESMYQLLFECALDRVFLVDLDGKIIDANSEVIKEYGYTHDELLSMNIREIRSPDERGSAEKQLKEAFENGMIYETIHRRKDGSTFPVEISSRGILLDNTDLILAIVRDITERKKAEQALRDSEQKCWAIFNWTFEFIGLLATDGTLLEVNRAALQLIGARQSDVLGKSIWATPWWSHSPELQQNLRVDIGKAAQGKFIRFESTHPAADGRLHYLDFSIMPFIDDAGKVVLLIIEGRDLTEYKLAEKALKKSQFILAKSQEMAHMGNWAWNVRTGEINMSDEGFRIFGYSPQEFQPTLGWLIYRVHPDDRLLVSGKFDSIHREAWLGSIDYRIILPNGTIQYLNTLADKIVRDHTGRISWVYGISQDITERKQVEEALLHSRRQLADIIDHLPDATLVVDGEKKTLVWNRAMEEMTGVKAADVMGKGDYEYAIPIYGERRPLLIDLIFEPEAAIKKWHYTNIKRVGHEIMAETLLSRPLQKSIVTWIKATPLFNGEGDQIGAIESIRDVTELRQAEAILRESEEKFRVLAETSPAAIFLYQDENFIYVNPSAERLSGFSKGELFKMNLWDIIHPDFRAMVREHSFARQLNLPVQSQYEFKYLRKNGDEGWALLSAGRIEYKGKPAGVGTIVDITKRKNAEEALAEAKNRAELYVDLMSHDISNLNQAIMGYLEIALDNPDLTVGEKDLLTAPVNLIQNSTRLIDDVKKIQRVKTGEITMEKLDLGEEITKVVAQYTLVPGRDVQIDYSPVPGCLVKGNSYVSEAFSQIVENAIKHSRGPLSIKITIDKVRVDARSYYKVIFEDNGPGIPDEQKKFIFIDIAKDKTKARRLGLGLQLVKAVVESACGRIWVEDRIPGESPKGSRFVVLLPTLEL